VRILPYLVPSTTLHGAVATFVDVTAYHDAKRLQSIIDALPEHIAVLDSLGNIVLVNAAWRRFARANGDESLKSCGPGSNYFNACKTDSEDDGGIASAALRGVRGVLEGTLPLFSLDYPCHSPTEERWFVMNVAPVAGEDFGAVVSHINITSWHKRKS
jgi:two-component system CheB/CheR fusion protein